jgi:DNA-binding MarR family transcriptional regulator
MKYSDKHRKMIVHILHTASWLDVKITAVLKDFDLTHVQFNILKVLEASHPQPLSVGKVKEGVLFPNSDMTRLMDRLEKKELIERKICPQNRRQVNVEITTRGLQLLKDIMPVLLQELDGYYADEFSAEEAVWIASKMKKIRNQ